MKKYVWIGNAKGGIEGGLRKVYIFKLLMHSLTTLGTHSAPVSADTLLNFHVNLLQNLRHLNSNKKPSQIITREEAYVNRKCRRENPRRVSRRLYFFKLQMHSLTTLGTYVCCTCFCRYTNWISHEPFRKF